MAKVSVFRKVVKYQGQMAKYFFFANQNVMPFLKSTSRSVINFGTNRKILKNDEFTNNNLCGGS
jgi:hypothetical protein